MKVVIQGSLVGAVLLGAFAIGAMSGSASAAPAGLQVSKHKLNFQLASGSSTSPPQMVKISNSGPAITGLSIQVTGRFRGAFQKDHFLSDCKTHLGYGSKVMATLTFPTPHP